MAHTRFTFGRGVFKCTACGRNTRLTTQANTDTTHCGQCDELAMLQNGLWDNGGLSLVDIAYRDAFAAKAVKQGGSEERIRASFKDLFDDPVILGEAT